MPIDNREDCQKPDKVWNELSITYGTKREWTQKDLKFMAPGMDKLNLIRPPYEVQMASGKLADPPTGVGGKPLDGTWRYVEIVGTDVATGVKTPIRVGKVRDH